MKDTEGQNDILQERKNDRQQTRLTEGQKYGNTDREKDRKKNNNKRNTPKERQTERQKERRKQTQDQTPEQHKVRTT